MNVLITAKNGQLGWELERYFHESFQKSQGWTQCIDLHCLDSKGLDITDLANIEKVFYEFRPDVVINAAAYTAVDRAEVETESAYGVNEQGVGNLARVCKALGTKLIHVSTDFVFSAKQNTPYKPEDPTGPLSVYGASKLAGEKLAREILAEDVCIVRTAWVYSIHGNNFVKTMIRLMGEKEQLGVVADQIGTPTSAHFLANAIWQLTILLNKGEETHPIYHWTDLGVASWYDFAVAIQEFALQEGLLQQAIPVKPIASEQYPTPAARPSYSVMDTSVLRSTLSISGVHWRSALGSMIKELATK